jgi:hypothetical protein
VNQGVIAARKYLFSWQVIVLFSGALGIYWYIVTLLIPEVQRLASLAPVIRIGAAAVLGPPLLILIVISLIGLILRAIPAYENISAFLWRALNILILWIMIPLLFFVLLIARPLQQHYMPKLGYLECGLLSGNPTLYFTDWVKNSAWCVKGKDREWVFEQAKLAEEKTVNPMSAPASVK